MPKTEIKLVEAQKHELDPSKKYLLIFDNHTISKEDIHILVARLKDMGIQSLGIALRDQGKIEVVEASA